MSKEEVKQLVCSAQRYGWGKKGSQSKVAQLLASSPSFSLNPSEPYAELWMGAHPSAPSFVLEESGEKTSLADWIEKNKSHALGDTVSRSFSQLPFLFKVLSVAQPLSIQAHPDKTLAKKLRQENPKHYPDDNHKPEIAIAVTPFEAMADFRPISEVKECLQGVPELVEAIGGTTFVQKALEEKDDKKVLRTLYSALMKNTDEKIKELLTRFVLRVENDDKSSSTLVQSATQLALRLHKDFPYDIGLFSPFFFNYVKLQPGEAIYLTPHHPHSYISGDLIECMSCSDNVVRAGLTPKFKDVDNLIQMLDYQGAKPHVMSPQAPSTSSSSSSGHVVKIDQFTNSYRPPIDEFEVMHTALTTSNQYQLPVVDGPSILLVYDGEGSMVTSSDGKQRSVKKGDVFFLSHRSSVTIQNLHNQHLQLFRACCNVKLFDSSPSVNSFHQKL
eukprot:TRINITY_DN6417_c0_g3_i1.p1 TRINITY_DN6417_c0_g3~~TRINITY_DN6417_c0_g3_i1.p1  ORF type:complete len:455 (+),score=112.31 TRINITY_DN6417_c0_g3_i1:36-1367(+)